MGQRRNSLQRDLDALASMHLSDMRRIELLEARVQLLEDVLDKLLAERLSHVPQREDRAGAPSMPSSSRRRSLQ
jgi:hypothetical protein